MWETTTNQHTKGTTMTLSHPEYDKDMEKNTLAALLLFKRHPQLGFPFVQGNHIAYWVYSNEDMKTVRRTLGLGTWAKSVDEGDDYFILTGTMADGTTVKIKTLRSLSCQRIVTGQTTVTEKVPDPEAMKNVPLVEITKDVDLVEWRCIPA